MSDPNEFNNQSPDSSSFGKQLKKKFTERNKLF